MPVCCLSVIWRVYDFLRLKAPQSCNWPQWGIQLNANISVILYSRSVLTT